MLELSSRHHSIRIYLILARYGTISESLKSIRGMYIVNESSLSMPSDFRNQLSLGKTRVGSCRGNYHPSQLFFTSSSNFNQNTLDVESLILKPNILSNAKPPSIDARL